MPEANNQEQAGNEEDMYAGGLSCTRRGGCGGCSWARVNLPRATSAVKFQAPTELTLAETSVEKDVVEGRKEIIEKLIVGSADGVKLRGGCREPNGRISKQQRLLRINRAHS